jgi:hypothetical protein
MLIINVSPWRVLCTGEQQWHENPELDRLKCAQEDKLTWRRPVHLSPCPTLSVIPHSVYYYCCILICIFAMLVTRLRSTCAWSLFCSTAFNTFLIWFWSSYRCIQLVFHVIQLGVFWISARLKYPIEPPRDKNSIDAPNKLDVTFSTHDCSWTKNWDSLLARYCCVSPMVLLPENHRFTHKHNHMFSARKLTWFWAIQTAE